MASLQIATGTKERPVSGSLSWHLSSCLWIDSLWLAMITDKFSTLFILTCFGEVVWSTADFGSSQDEVSHLMTSAPVKPFFRGVDTESQDCPLVDAALVGVVRA
eukprot:CAMPEP_0206620634 /NCGR_PEP_ID=MMETSP0325_2-20121206/61725_1 /ASSEMBLY_ACC=CAM_ASM_000347 /TAXON_ID=2866 /ORGANISM="Crypthecodinium cohnii, Strain Seligo" /LENGTH=103 /DNA_ID=CAMNT_0054143601 /DNA_START=396 /DNA_END=708 /DNA_ORIENTATION=-